MPAVQHIALRIPLGLYIMILLVACATAGIIKAEEEALAAASGLLSERGMSPEGAVIVEGGLFRGLCMSRRGWGQKRCRESPYSRESLCPDGVRAVALTSSDVLVDGSLDQRSASHRCHAVHQGIRRPVLGLQNERFIPHMLVPYE